MKKTNCIFIHCRFLVSVVLCLTLLVGCASLGDTVPATTVPDVTLPTAPAEPIIQRPPMLLYMSRPGEPAAENELFELEEYPGIQFVLHKGRVFYLDGDVERPVLSNSVFTSIYLADLDGDGDREFCGSYLTGSGHISRHIMVCDFEEDRYYTMGERPEFDYLMQIEAEEFVVYRIPHQSQHFHDELVEITDDAQRGQMKLSAGSLTYVSEAVVSGQLQSPQFGRDTLTKIVRYVEESLTTSSSTIQIPTDAKNYFMEKCDVDLSGVIEIREGRMWYDFSKITAENREEIQYLLVLGHLTYYTHLCYMLERYGCQDPNDPAQFIICTEIRDYGYRTIDAYAQALAAGECQPHPETFYVRLDELAIYQYGSDENLYATICGVSQ